MLDPMLFGELLHQFGSAHLLCSIYNFYGNIIYLLNSLITIMLIIYPLLLCLSLQGIFSRQLIMIECLTRHGVRYPQIVNQHDHSNITNPADLK